jgi:predicted ferric reductase
VFHLRSQRLFLIPAILIAILSTILILYTLFLSPAKDSRGGPPPDRKQQNVNGQFQRQDDAAGNYKTLGDIAIICAAVSFTWLRFKKKRVSLYKPVKKLANLLYSIHTYMGWAAIILITVHGGYYILKDFNNHSVLSGIAAFLLLLTLAIYGWLFRRAKKPIIRKIHYLLACSLIVAALVHAGNFVILTALLTIAAWFIIGWVEKAAMQKAP